MTTATLDPSIESPTARTGRAYWQAQGIAEITLGHFTAALAQHDRAAERRAFYLLANYYGRTLRIVRSALTSGKDPLAQAALRNIVALHRPLTIMHRSAPHAVPLAVLLDRDAREDFTRDLIVRVLNDSPLPLTEATVVTRTNDLNVLGTVAPGTVHRHLRNLEASGHVERAAAGYRRTRRSTTELDVDAASLKALVGPDLARDLGAQGFRGLHEVIARPEAFRTSLTALCDVAPATADAFFEAIASLQDAQPPAPSGWRHADLLNSPYPRPYQYEAYTVFRGSGYHGQLVESPTGSGKTLIGMLCIQDFLQMLRPGQSILVLVPTANYQQQWIGELCFKPIGLRLPPELVYAGTPGQLERFQRRTGSHPAIVLMTYAALAQTGPGIGKGGFDIDSVETFLQNANVQYVILDEVHKVVEDMKSVSADVTRQLTEWLRDGSIRGLIGFSGTAEAYRPRFAEVGLSLAHAIPLDTLIGYGFVAPFTELGVPFANSARERRIRDLLDDYKAQLLAFRDLLDSGRLRTWFAEVPLTERVAIGTRLLGMYRGRPDAATATGARLSGWESGGVIGLAELQLITILQLARGWSDSEMAVAADVPGQDFAVLRDRLETIRTELAQQIYLPATVKRLREPGFMTTALAAADVDAAHATATSASARAERTDDALAVTAVGLYASLADWYLRAGEGRVETIKALIDAERAVRTVTGVIVFDVGKRIRWRGGVTAPGYEGVGGLFAQILGDKRFVAFAALSSEMYLTLDPDDPLPPRIAEFIARELLRGEVADAIFGLATQGLDVPSETLQELHADFDTHLDAYVTDLVGVRSRRLGEFRRRVLGPFRRTVRRLLQGTSGERLRARLQPGNVHLEELIATFFDYAELAESFRTARVAEIEQVSGARQPFYVIPMPAGRRKQLMYDLTARIVDADTLPVNLVIVSSWARTGWNVIKPNVLIDATATRDITAWQQLRGRAMRALRTWTNDCYRYLVRLNSAEGLPGELPTELTEAALATEIGAPVRARLNGDATSELTAADREALRIGLMLGRNKVTHIYELVKAFGGARQVEYDRPSRTWRRREAIERKHAYESAVDPLSGTLRRGVAHAPLVYLNDPRLDLPVDLQARVSEVIRGRDPAIVAGWLRAAEAD